MIPKSWQPALGPVLADKDAANLAAFLDAERARGAEIFPPESQWFAALELTPRDAVKVVILGQDPYHGEGQAHGLAFSVAHGVRPPPSLGNIYKELASDLGVPRPDHGHLAGWARQGVLLLNTVLTVENGKAASHAGKGWEQVTDALVRDLAQSDKPLVFILWGNHARKKAKMIRAYQLNASHLVIESAHPSPLSARHGFFGSKPFSRANAFLESAGRTGIDWAALDN